MAGVSQSRIKKIVGGGLAFSVKPDSMTVNPVKMTATGVISTESVDRSGEIVRLAGLRLDNHRRNPLVLLAHDKSMPVGRAQDRNGNYTVGLNSSGQLEATTHFFQGSELGEQAFRLVEMGALPALSIGFIEDRGAVNKKSLSDGRTVTIFTASELIEYSHHTFGENPDCIVRVVEKGLGGRRLCAPLLSYLTPLIPGSRKPLANGWRAKMHDMPAENGAPMDAMEPAPKVPTGAMAYQTVYDLFMDGASAIADLLPQLEPDTPVLAHLQEINDMIAQTAQEIAGTFAERYPDLPKLDDVADEGVEEMPEDTPEVDPDSAPVDDESGDSFLSDLESEAGQPEMTDDERERKKEEMKALKAQKDRLRHALRGMRRKYLEKISLLKSGKPLEDVRTIMQWLAGFAKQRGLPTANDKRTALEHAKTLAAVVRLTAPFGPPPARARREHQQAHTDDAALDLSAINSALTELNAKFASVEGDLYSITGKG